MGLFGLGKNKKLKNLNENNDTTISLNNNESEDECEYISVYEAADIWVSNGEDEDYMFGYTREELENALK